jgi:hypothetical protein
LDAPLTLADSEGADGGRALFVYYGEEEVCFDDPRFFEFARRLVRQASFRAGDAVKWVKRGTWAEIHPMLETLIQLQFLGLTSPDRRAT